MTAQPSARADIDTGLAGPAMVFREGLVNGQGQIGIEFTQEKPGTGLGVNQVGVFSQPAKPGVACQCLFKHRGTIDKCAVTKLASGVFNMNCEGL